MISRASRQEKKLKLWLRSQLTLKQGFERIDYYEDVIMPEIEALKAGRSVMGLEPGAAFEMRMELPRARRRPRQAKKLA